VLLFTVIVFLVAAIGSTLFGQWLDGGERRAADAAIDTFAGIASTSNLVLTGTVPDQQALDREANVQAMRVKVAQADLAPAVVESEPVVQPAASTTPTATSTDTVEEPVEVAPTPVMTCASYTPYVGFWDARNATVVPKEGAIVIERPVGTSTETMLQLTTRSMPAATPTCLSSDVIGIANDGSLIRNDEFAFYGVFGAETRVGYALDGLPIHGVGTVRGDVCGGRIVAGQYRYELSTSRDTLINCFAATPTRLP